ncbi:MAG: sulfotransferase domain-containing protein [Gallionella sp.]
MIVFVAGMPRAGSMWTYNVIRAIFATRDWSVLPTEIPIIERALIKTALLSAPKENEVYCIKTHLPLKSPLPTKHDVKIICNIRDVRDACLSFMRFMHADYAGGIRAMINMMKITDYYLSQFGDNLLSVRYEDLTQTPSAVLANLCGFLKIDLSETEQKAILQEFDKSAIQKKLQEMPKIEAGINVREDNKQNLKFDAVLNRDGTYRAYEKMTGFQSNHITSSDDGEWKTCFDKSQIDQLINLSEKWLLKYGYKI